MYKAIGVDTGVVWVPSERWQSCPVQESLPPSVAVGIMPQVSPCLSTPEASPHQPTGMQKKYRDVFQSSTKIITPKTQNTHLKH